MEGNEVLRAVVAKLHREELDALPDNDYLREHLEVSPEFHEKMRKLINRSRRLGVVKRVTRAVAGFFIAALAGLLLLCAVNEDIRAFCVQFVKERLMIGMTRYSDPVDKSAVFRENEGKEEKEKGFVRFELGYVPEGFEYDGENSYVHQETGKGSLVYINKEKNDTSINLLYFLSDTSTISVDNENSKFSTVYLEDGTKCDYYKSSKKDSTDVLLWTSGEYNLILQIDNTSVDWDDEEVIKIANGVKRENDKVKLE